ncbi:MAG: PQQ-binding-like beta-propeller repeat protein [Solirubrobacteraceae bacterium]
MSARLVASRRLRRLATPPLVLALAALLIAACGGSAAPASAPSTAAGSTAAPASPKSPTSGDAATSNGAGNGNTARAAAALRSWPEFGLNPQRSDATNASTGITAANVGHLHRLRIALPGTVDSSPIYLHGVTVAGAVRDVVLVTTTYGKTLVIDASDGHVLWTFTPPGYSGWAGSAQITVASPLADPDRAWVYAASPNGLIHKLSLADGSEDRSGSWPVSVTRDPTHEKLAAALNIDGPYILTATGGYFGDTPPYQGHVVVIERSSGRLVSLFNTLCANRRALQIPSTCSASDSAILSRGGPVVEPGGRRILIDTGNGPWNGTTNFGDSLLELTVPNLQLRQAFTPVDQEHLNTNDLDLGSSAPALLGDNRVMLAGKDGIMRVLALSRLAGHPPVKPPSGRHATLGGEVQQLPTPHGGQLFTAPAVWHHGGHTTVFVADFEGAGAYELRGGRLKTLWTNDIAGTSPIVAGGLLYIYEPGGGGIEVYNPSGSSHPIAKLPGSPGHWNSPIVVDGQVVEPEGDANEHQLSGTLDLFSVG